LARSIKSSNSDLFLEISCCAVALSNPGSLKLAHSATQLGDLSAQTQNL
jgi:hypothetical protein